MLERPILFSAPMVRALLDGTKTQTRRVVKPQPVLERVFLGGHRQIVSVWKSTAGPDGWLMHKMCPYGQPGDRLIPAIPLPGYDKRYCVDVYGDVWSRAKGEWKRLTPGVTSKGYRTITPARDGKYATQLVHRLVCEAFYGPAPAGLDQVRHLNGDQADNAPENLDWGTQEQNWCDRAAHGGGMGEAHHAAKLTQQDVAAIRESEASQRALAVKYGVSQSTIQSARVGDHWMEVRAPAPVNIPRWASRIVLEITGVRVEQLQSIGEADARAEGVTIEDRHTIGYCAGEFLPPSIRAYRDLWESINGAGRWEANPWVWVVEFKLVRP